MGKSTLLNVLIGIQQLDSGSYEVNHSEVNGNWAKLHEYFSFIQQKPFILDDTLKYNITLGRHVSEEDLNYAVEQAGLTDLVNEKGLDYQLGKGGSNLSGGQNQRVEIARALVSKRPILLADEATSSLDQNLSLQIHQTILSEFKGTVIEVAHHISTNEKEMFDQIVDLAKQS
ncbi:ATP-binding cassette domain-containing protein [Lactobacillus sp. R2/2]|nr:ATP-binding cassette domain-containing protein [Lactobacillus sp. R2/2]